MTVENNKTLVREYLEKVWNNADMGALEAMTTQGFKYTIGGQAPRDLAAMKQFVLAQHKAFPDWHIHIVDMIAEGNKVTIRWEGQATHLGFLQTLPPSGRKATVCGINIYHIEGDKIAAEWEQFDMMGLLKQLGVLK